MTYNGVGEGSVDFGNRQSVSSERVLEGVEKNGTPTFGVGLFEILRHLQDEELKYVRRKPLDIVLPQFGSRNQLFLASALGYLSPGITKIFNEDFKNEIEAQEVAYTLSNFTDAFHRSFLRRISALYHVKVYRERTGLRDAFVFYLDANKAMDVIDFWNLRAMGLQVVPLPKQVAHVDTIRNFAVDFINQNYYPLKNNPSVHHQPTLLKSRSISQNEFQTFIKNIGPLVRDESGISKPVMQDWYPAIWDEWQRKQKYVDVGTLVSSSDSHEIQSTDDRISFGSLDPEFIALSGGHGEPRFANEVNVRVFGGDELYAEVIPEGSKDLGEAFGLWSGVYKFRFSTSGMVRLYEFPNKHAYLHLPKAEDVFVRWLKGNRWEVALSDKGRIAKQMLKRLGGKVGINALAIDGLIKLLGTLTEGKTINEQTLNGELARIVQQELGMDSKSLLEVLTEVEMFRVGMELKCPVCTQRSWFSISEADYELRCQKCLERFLIPSHSPKDIKWSYRTFGPFSLPNQAYGVYCVLLAFRFFSVLLDSATTPMMSFEATREGNSIEVDLGLLFQKSRYRRSNAKTKLIFCECKTYNAFERKDIQRMQLIGQQFPGATLVFATLRDALSLSEKYFFRQIVNRQRRLQSKGRPFNPVLILTATELFSKDAPPYCWRKLSGIGERFTKWYSADRDMVHLSDATQQLYLDIPGYEYLPLEEPL